MEWTLKWSDYHVRGKTLGKGQVLEMLLQGTNELRGVGTPATGSSHSSRDSLIWVYLIMPRQLPSDQKTGLECHSINVAEFGTSDELQPSPGCLVHETTILWYKHDTVVLERWSTLQS